MTKIIENFTGIDVSKKSFNVAIEKNGKIQSKEFLYTAEGMKSCLGFIPAQSRCIIESTGTYHCRLACYLTDNNISVSVVNPLSVKRFAQALMSRTKTDKADCRMLIEYGKHFDVKQWQPQESVYIQMRQLLNLSSQLIKQQTALENQLEAIEHSVVQSPVVIDKIESLLQTCRDEQNAIEQELEKLVKDCEQV
jgi:transposase